MRMAVRIARLIREGHKVADSQEDKNEEAGHTQPQPSKKDKRLGRKGWKEYAALLDQHTTKQN